MSLTVRPILATVRLIGEEVDCKEYLLTVHDANCKLFD